MLPIIFILLFTGLAVGFPQGENLQELPNLMQTQDDAYLRDFKTKVDTWVRLFKTNEDEYVALLEKCRRSFSQCEQVNGTRRLIELTDTLSQLTTQFKPIFEKYESKISANDFDAGLKTVKKVVSQY